MKQSDAIRHLRNLQFSFLKLRSIIREDRVVVEGLDEADRLAISESMAASVWPWVWGEKCILPALSQVIDDYEAGKGLAPMSFYNLVVVATRLEPMLEAITNISLVARDMASDFPVEANIHWLSGWDKEEV